MDVPFFDLNRQYLEVGEAVEEAALRVLRSQQYIGGEEVAALEAALAERVGVRHAVGVSSGTDALLVSLMALGVGPGDEVITTPFTFFSPVGAVLRCGATPVFVDIDPETFNLDVGMVEAAITERTRAILPVHLFGQMCAMSALEELVQDRGISVVEDMAQAIDATHRGRKAGSIGDLGCVSFFPTKNLGAAGDGGMVFCDDDQLATRVRRLARHGAEPKYHHREVGGNFRLDPLQAAILRVKLEHLEQWTRARREHAAFYDRELGALNGLVRPVVRPENESVFNQYVLRVENRDELQRQLGERGISTNVYYPEPLHWQPALRQVLKSPQAFPEAEKACEEVLALPIFPELTGAEREAVVAALKELT